MPPKILLFGSGAIGTIYVYLLLKAGCDVTAVCRSNYQAAKANGFIIDSDLYGKSIHITPKVVRTPEEAAPDGPFDYVLVCSKALPGPRPSTAEIIAPAVTEAKTCIVLIQNGIGIEDEYATAFPENPLLSCVVYLPTTQTEPGRIQMGNFELLQIGAHPASSTGLSPVRKAADTLLEILKSVGGNAHLFDDIQPKRWSKLILNASWNPICALTLSRDVAYLQSSSMAEQYVEDVMLEVVQLARALGYKDITAQAAKDQLARAQERIGTTGIEPSMLVDVLNGRRMEVEVIIGAPVRMARSLGLSVPRLDSLYVLAKALDEAIALRQSGKSLGGNESANSRAN